MLVEGVGKISIPALLFADDLSIGSLADNGLQKGVDQVVKMVAKELSKELNKEDWDIHICHDPKENSAGRMCRN
jgi:hypothetical protein